MIERHLSNEVTNLMLDYPIIIITGPRQIGKSYMISKLLNIKNLTSISMDNDFIRQNAIEQPNLFFESYKTPLFIDEVQKATAIFNTIKLIADREKTNGLFILTGSQKFTLMKHVSESLAGRAAILEMQSLSQSEINEFDNFTLNSTYSEIEKRFLKYKDKRNINILDRIVNGSMPDIVEKVKKNRSTYYKSYIDSVLFRDINDDIAKIYNTFAFKKFLKIIANYSGNLLNINNIARDVSVS
jgi:predicted AAA+ superfamily ATPase